MKLLITGGGGFIGSALGLRALRLGHQVVTLDKLTYAANPLTIAALQAEAGHCLEQIDVADEDGVAAALNRHAPDVILHLAAELHVDRSIDQPGTFVQTNVVGTFSLLHAALGYWRALSAAKRQAFRLIHVSTDEVFGSLGPTGVFHEDSAYAPNSPYAASKAGADHLARAWHSTYGLPVIITNCSNNYGPRQFPEKLLPLIISNAAAGKPLPIYGDGANVRDWLYVEDHADALLSVAERAEPGSRYMIGGGAERTNLELVLHVCALLDELLPDSAHRPHRSLITHVADRPGHDRRYAADFSRIHRELGWKPSVTLEEGLRQTVLWYLANKTWCEACGDNATRRQGAALPETPGHLNADGTD